MNLNPIQKKWLYRALIALIFVFAFAIRIQHLSEKKGFHMDEVLSVIIVGNSDIGWKCTPPEGVYTGGEIESMIFKIDPSLKGTLRDVATLWDSNRDSPHTSFYYILLRTSLFGLNATDVEDFKAQYILRAGVLNLIIFVFAYFAFLGLLKLITKDKSLILLGLIVAFWNKIDVANTLFFRPYALQTLFVIIFTAFLIWVAKKIAKDEYKESWQNIFIFALPLSLMLLTGYYAFVYAFFLGLCFVAFPLRRAKKFNLIPFFFFGACLAVLYDLLFYNDFMAGFYSYRTFESLGVSSRSKGLSIDSIFTLFDILKGGVFYIWALAFLVLAIIYKIKNKESFVELKTYGWCVLASFIYSFVLMLIAPYKDVRYISSYVAILALIYPLVLMSIKNLYAKRSISFAIALVFLFIAIKGEGIPYKYAEEKGSFPSVLKEQGLSAGEIPVYICIFRTAYSAIADKDLDKNQKFIICESADFLLDKVEGKDCFILFNESLSRDLDLAEHGFEKLETRMPQGIKVFKTK